MPKLAPFETLAPRMFEGRGPFAKTLAIAPDFRFGLLPSWDVLLCPQVPVDDSLTVIADVWGNPWMCPVGAHRWDLMLGSDPAGRSRATGVALNIVSSLDSLFYDSNGWGEASADAEVPSATEFGPLSGWKIENGVIVPERTEEVTRVVGKNKLHFAAPDLLHSARVDGVRLPMPIHIDGTPANAEIVGVGNLWTRTLYITRLEPFDEWTARWHEIWVAVQTAIMDVLKYASVGLSLGGPLGAIIGAAVGLAIGIADGIGAQDAERKARGALLGKAEVAEAATVGDLREALKPRAVAPAPPASEPTLNMRNLALALLALALLTRG